MVGAGQAAISPLDLVMDGDTLTTVPGTTTPGIIHITDMDTDMDIPTMVDLTGLVIIMVITMDTMQEAEVIITPTMGMAVRLIMVREIHGAAALLALPMAVAQGLQVTTPK